MTMLPLIRSRPPAQVTGGSGGGVRPTRNEDPSRFFPETGAAVVVTVPADGSWSLYASGVLTADSGAECNVATINAEYVHSFATGPGARAIFVEVAVGADGLEVPIGTWPDTNLSTATDQRYQRQFRLNGYTLAANSRLVFRARLNVAHADSTHKVAVAVVCPPTPVLFTDDWDEDTYMQGGVSSEEMVPAPVATTAVACGLADAWGNPVELDAAAANRQLLYGVNVQGVGPAPPPYPSRVALQFGVGAMGSEKWHEATQLVAVTTVPSGQFELPRSVEVLTDDRVIVRAQGNVASKNVNLALIMHNLNF